MVWMKGDGRIHLDDRHSTGHRIPKIDQSQDYHLIEGQQVDMTTRESLPNTCIILTKQNSLIYDSCQPSQQWFWPCYEKGHNTMRNTNQDIHLDCRYLRNHDFSGGTKNCLEPWILGLQKYSMKWKWKKCLNVSKEVVKSYHSIKLLTFIHCCQTPPRRRSTDPKPLCYFTLTSCVSNIIYTG